MRCEVTSSTEHKALISKEVKVPTYKHVCRGEQKKVNLGYNNWILPIGTFYVMNNTLNESVTLYIPDPRRYAKGTGPCISLDWEVLTTFFNIHQIVPTWFNCRWGGYTCGDDSKWCKWTGCMRMVRILVYVSLWSWSSLACWRINNKIRNIATDRPRRKNFLILFPLLQLLIIIPIYIELYLIFKHWQG